VVLSSLSLFNAAGSIVCPNFVDIGKNKKNQEQCGSSYFSDYGDEKETFFILQWGGHVH
jgi:hypothetical protein